MRTTRILLFAVLSCTLPAFGAEPRARDLGIPFDGKPGALNAITDVTGVTVGHETLIRDLPEERAVRTGVTAILPRGRESLATMVYAGWHALNGNGEMTGTTWLEESGFLEGPVMITNTHSIGAVHEGVIKWRIAQGDADATGYYWSLPVVAETWDGWLNDVNGFHVRPEHAGKALDAAKPGPVTEGAVGGGTGMVCFEFKCGIGTASRVVEADGKVQTLGVLVQANFGVRAELTVAGVPVGGRVSGATVYSAVAPTGRSNSEPREPLERAMRATGLSGEVAPTGRSNGGAPTVRSSPSWPPTRHFCRTSSSGSHGGYRSVSHVPAASRTMDPATSSSRSRRRMPTPPAARPMHPSVRFRTRAWTRCSKPRCRRRKKRY